MTTTRVSAIGILVGLVFGEAGGLVHPPQLQDALWAISSVGLVLGAVLLATRHMGAGRAPAAAGFLILAMAECVMWSGGSMASEAGRQAFGAGTLYYVPALALLAAAPTYHWVARTGAAAACLAFLVHAANFALGDAQPSSSPAAVAGYMGMAVCGLGWVVEAWRAPRAVHAD